MSRGLGDVYKRQAFRMGHNFQAITTIKQHNNKDNRRPTSLPNKDVIQLPAHTCWNLHSLITLKLLQPVMGPGITPSGDLDQRPSSLGKGHHRFVSLPDGFHPPGCHLSHLLACSGSDHFSANFTSSLLSLALGNSPKKSEVWWWNLN